MNGIDVIFVLVKTPKLIQGLIIFGYTWRMSTCTLPSPLQILHWILAGNVSVSLEIHSHFASRHITLTHPEVRVLLVCSGTASHSSTEELHPPLALSLRSWIESQHCLSAVTLSEGSLSRDSYRASLRSSPQLLCLAATSPGKLDLG